MAPAAHASSRVLAFFNFMFAAGLRLSVHRDISSEQPSPAFVCVVHFSLVSFPRQSLNFITIGGRQSFIQAIERIERVQVAERGSRVR